MARSSRKPVQTSVVVPEEVYARVQRMAEAKDVAVAWVIRHAVQRFLGGYGYQTEHPLGIVDEGQVQSGR